METTLSMNTLRVVLVGLTVLAVIVAVFLGQWEAALYLAAAVAVHGGLWLFLAKQREARHEALHAGVEQYLREGDDTDEA